MAFKDSGGSATWAGFRTSAYGLVSEIDIVNVEPKDRTRVGATIAPLSVLVDSVLGNVDVEFQVATDAAFTAVVRTTTLTNLPSGPALYSPAGLTQNTTYYWRARAALTGTTTWTAWTGSSDLVGASPYDMSAKTASASSVFSGTYAAAKAFNNTVASDPEAWAALSGAFPAHVQVDNGSTISVAAYKISPRPDVIAQTPTSWKLQGSADGTTWVDLDTKSGYTWGGTTPVTFPLPGGAASYRYWRLGAITTVMSGAIAAISELTLYATVGYVATPWRFLVDVNASIGFQYVYDNQGIDPNTRKSADPQYTSENVGFPIAYYHGDIEYNFGNVGFPRLLEDAGIQYVFEGDVSTNRPTPHLWFIYLPYGFAGEEVWAYGHGFGNPQSEYSGLMKIDAGPDYGDPDILAGINEWYLKEIEDHAYDADRIIYPGGDGSPPNVTMECEIIRFVVPGGIAPELEPVIHRMYVEHTGGPSNKVDWTMYATLPVAAANVQRAVVTQTLMRLSAPIELAGIEQLFFFHDTPEYVITGGRAERPALFSAGATGVAELGEWSVEDSLSDALSVNLGASHRWLPDPATMVPRPDLGTGTVVWTPSAGSTAVGWKLRADSSPYIEPAYVVPSRMGDLELPAMVFPGDAFAELTDAIAAGPTFTVAIVAVLHAPPGGRGTIVSTFRDEVMPADHDWELHHESDRMRLQAGGMLVRRNLNLGSGRPVIIVATVGSFTTQLIVVDDAPSTHAAARPPMAATGNKAYLARSWRLDDDTIDFASMDVLDVSWWQAPLTLQKMWSVANKLDGIYGVTR